MQAAPLPEYRARGAGAWAFSRKAGRGGTGSGPRVEGRVRQLVVGIVAEYGFTIPTLQIDYPGHHESDARDPVLGARFAFGTEGFTDMQVTTGCHRTR